MYHLTKTFHYLRFSILLVIAFSLISLSVSTTYNPINKRFSSKAQTSTPIISYSSYFGGDGQDTINVSITDSAGNFYLAGNSNSTNFPLKFSIQDRSKGGLELVVVKLSPTGQVLFSTYLGGANDERALQIKVDKSGNTYVLGATNSRNLTLSSNAFQPSYKKTSAEAFFIAKIDSNGKLVYSTYLGRGGEVNNPSSFSVDDAGNAYLLGITSGKLFPTVNAFQSIYGNRDDFKDNDSDGFLVKLDPQGQAIFSTFIGGIGLEDFLKLKFDPLGNIYVVGTTDSKSFPTKNPVQKKFGGATDGVVVKFSPKGEAIYSTFLGGRGFDDIRDFVVDTAGNVTVVGKTGSQNFPVSNAFQPSSGGFDDVFITKLSSQGTLIYSTYLGGNGNELNGNLDLRLALDNSGNLLLAGTTFSGNFPLFGNSLQRAYNGAGDVFLAKIGITGTPIYSTYLGGQGLDNILRITSDDSGNVYLVGETASQDFPLLNPFQRQEVGDKNLFVSKINSNGALAYSTYLGGRLGQELSSFVLDPSGNVYLTGRTKSLDFPTRNAFQPQYGGGFGSFYDAFITKMNANGDVIFSTYLGGSKDENDPAPGFFVIDSTGSCILIGTTASPDLPTQNAVQTSLAGSSDLYLAKFDAQGRIMTSTYLGGNGNEQQTSIIVGNNGTIYLTGITGSNNFPTLNGVQNFYGGGSQDGFFLAIAP